MNIERDILIKSNEDMMGVRIALGMARACPKTVGSRPAPGRLFGLVEVVEARRLAGHWSACNELFVSQCLHESAGPP